MNYNLQKNQNAEQTYHSIRNSIVSAQHRLSTAVTSSFGEKINGRKNISDSLRNNPLLDKRFTPG